MRYLVEFDIIEPNTQAVSTLYFTSGNRKPPFLPDDASRPNRWYDPRVQDLNGIGRGMFQRGRTYGKSEMAGGTITLNNADGGLDYLYDYGYAGRPVAVYVGDGDAFADYRLYFNGVIDALEFSYSRSGSGSITLTVRSQKRLFDKAIQTHYYLGTNSGSTGNEGESGSSIVNQLKPLCFGEVKNITPVLVNAAGLRYQVHDGAIQAVDAVYANGVALTASGSPTPPAGYYYADLTTGIMTLGSNPAGQTITCDVKGAKFGSPATYQNQVAAIVYGLLKDYYGLLDTDIDTAALSALDSAAPYAVGVYLSGVSKPEPDQASTLTYASVFDTLMQSIGAWWGFNNANRFTAGQFAPPDAASAVAEFDPYDIIDIELIKNADENAGVPLATLTLLAQRNFTVQASGLAGSVTVSRQAWLKDEYRTFLATHAANATIYNADIARMTRVTHIVDSADAEAEAARLMAIYQTSRKLFRVVLDQSAIPAILDLGKVITVRFPRFGLNSGKQFVVTSIKNNYPKLNQVELDLYG
jgi:hypothetical protein